MTRLEELYLLADLSVSTQCSIWPYAKSSKGYPYVQVDGRTVRAHVVICETVHGPRPEGQEAAHSCGQRACINPHHLRWATRAENAADKVAHGRVGRSPKLTDEQVIEIRRLAAKGVTQRVIATKFDVSQATVGHIVRGVTWRHLLAANAA